MCVIIMTNSTSTQSVVQPLRKQTKKDSTLTKEPCDYQRTVWRKKEVGCLHPKFWGHLRRERIQHQTMDIVNKFTASSFFLPLRDINGWNIPTPLDCTLSHELEPAKQCKRCSPKKFKQRRQLIFLRNYQHRNNGHQIFSRNDFVWARLHNLW